VPIGKYGRCGSVITFAPFGTMTVPAPNGHVPATREQRRLARTGGAGHQHALAGGDGDVVDCNQRRSLGSRTRRLIDLDRALPLARGDLDRGCRRRRRLAPLGPRC